MILINSSVGENQYIGTILVRLIHLHKQPVNGSVQTGAFIIRDRHHCYLEAVHLHVFDLQHICIGQNRIVNLQYLAVFRLLLQQVSVFSHIYGGAGDNFFTNSVNRRICHLCKQLFEIVKQRLMLLREHSKWCICSHCRDPLRTIQGHAVNRFSVVLISISKCLLHSGELFPFILLHPDVGNLQVVQFHQVTVQPLTVRLFFCVNLLYFIIAENLSFSRIDQQNFAGMQTFLQYDLLLRHRHDPHF